MKFSTKSVIYGALLLMMGACADETPFKGMSEDTGEGRISLSITTSDELSTAIPKTRAVTTTVSTPPKEKFQVRLSKVDGTFAKTWSSIDEFAKEDKFSIGIYELEVFFGTPDAQGVVSTTGGAFSYDHAYYYGKSEEIIVKEGEETPVSVLASLGNSLVQVEYTDEFKKYFNRWNTTLQTEGTSDVEIGGAEVSSYVTPGLIDIIMDAELQNGKKVFLNPAAFYAEAQHLYKVTYNVHNGEVGDASLQITFNDDPIKEHVIEINLNELENAAAPEITTIGFDNNTVIETQAGVPFEEGKEVKFSVLAPGKIAKAILTIDCSTGYLPSFMNSKTIDLCEATVDQQSKMTNEGITARGFFGAEPSQMGYLDLTDFCATLPAGEHTITLQVTDQYSQVNEIPAKCQISSVRLTGGIISSEAYMGNGYAEIKISYDGPDPTQPGANPFSFEMINPNTGTKYSVDVLSIENDNITRANYESKYYICKVSLPAAEAEYYRTSLFLGKTKLAVTTDHELKIICPYKVEADAFAKKIYLKINDIYNEYDLSSFYNDLKIYVNSVEYANKSIDNQNGLITLSDLKPDTEYTISTNILTFSKAQKYTPTLILKTEAAASVPNSDLSMTENLLVDPINVGGPYEIKVVVASHQQITSSINRDVPAGGWATLNDLTCYSGSTNKNTWYMEPSTFIEGNDIVIRSVGYNHNGPEIPESKNGATTTYYCKNIPKESDIHPSIGELFLGSYSYNGVVPRVDGINFSSRPASFSFSYTYNSVGNEKGYVSIILYDKNGNILSRNEKELLSSSLPSYVTLPLANVPFGGKADKLEISFKSANVDSTPQIEFPKNLSEGRTSFTYLADEKKDPNDYITFTKGSELKISNLYFNY